jgi:hypothetical protein
MDEFYKSLVEDDTVCLLKILDIMKRIAIITTDNMNKELKELRIEITKITGLLDIGGVNCFNDLKYCINTCFFDTDLLNKIYELDNFEIFKIEDELYIVKTSKNYKRAMDMK